MKRLEKIFVIGGLVIGGSLLGLGFYFDSQLMRASGVLSLTYPAGVGMKALLEESDRTYFEEKNNNYPR